MPTPDHPRAQGSKMEILPEALGRSTEQNQPLENLRNMKLWRTIEKKSLVPVRQHFVPSNVRYPSLPVSLSFIAQGGRPFITRLHHINSLPFRTEILLDSLPIEYCYLGFDFCTYLSTIQQSACPRVRVGSQTLHTVCAWGRFSSRQREM